MRKCLANIFLIKTALTEILTDNIWLLDKLNGGRINMKKIITIVLIVFLWMGNSKAQDVSKINKLGINSKPLLADIDSLTHKTGITVTDIDGDVYHIVKIGTQGWMVENLKVTKFNDDMAILLASDSSSWSSLTTSGYCWYNNDASTNKNIYGALYNWSSVKTENLGPLGWHVPNNDDWSTLVGYLGRESVSGYRLKGTGTAHWQSPTRVTHNDTKINNILFDKTGNVLCVIDLDTVLNSTALNDFGDAIRSYTNTGLEDDPDLDQVSMNIEIFEAFSKGYLEEAQTFLTQIEKDHLAFSARYITYEQVLRFLMDYIDGDHYYKVKSNDHNLIKTYAQYKLLQSMEDQFDTMNSIIKKYC